MDDDLFPKRLKVSKTTPSALDRLIAKEMLANPPEGRVVISDGVQMALDELTAGGA